MSSKTSFLSLVSITSVLVLLHLFGLLITHSDELVKMLKEKVNILVELTDDIEDEDQKSLLTELQSNEAIISNSVRYVDKKEAFKLVSDGAVSATMNEVPFKNSVLLNIKADHYNSAYLEDLKGHLISRSYISDVFYQDDVFDEFKDNMNKLGLLLLGLGLGLLFFVIIIIYNTVKLSLANDAQKIQTMSLVGATWGYIRKPYRNSAILMGTLASLLAIGIGILLFYSLGEGLFDIAEFINWNWVYIVSFTILCIGIVVPLTATSLIVYHYLKKTSYH